jgi:hypothetical protein
MKQIPSGIASVDYDFSVHGFEYLIAICVACYAIYFMDEKPSLSPAVHPEFGNSVCKSHNSFLSCTLVP